MEEKNYSFYRRGVATYSPPELLTPGHTVGISKFSIVVWKAQFQTFHPAKKSDFATSVCGTKSDTYLIVFKAPVVWTVTSCFIRLLCHSVNDFAPEEFRRGESGCKQWLKVINMKLWKKCVSVDSIPSQSTTFGSDYTPKQTEVACSQWFTEGHHY